MSMIYNRTILYIPSAGAHVSTFIREVIEELKSTEWKRAKVIFNNTVISVSATDKPQDAVARWNEKFEKECGR